MSEISLQYIYLGCNKLSKVHLEAQLITASGFELLRYRWSYTLVFIFLTDHTSKKDFSGLVCVIVAQCKDVGTPGTVLEQPGAAFSPNYECTCKPYTAIPLVSTGTDVTIRGQK